MPMEIRGKKKAAGKTLKEIIDARASGLYRIGDGGDYVYVSPARPTCGVFGPVIFRPSNGGGFCLQTKLEHHLDARCELAPNTTIILSSDAEGQL
jgi:hypothetical protein